MVKARTRKAAAPVRPSKQGNGREEGVDGCKVVDCLCRREQGREEWVYGAGGGAT